MSRSLLFAVTTTAICLAVVSGADYVMMNFSDCVDVYINLVVIPTSAAFCQYAFNEFANCNCDGDDEEETF
jgi:hypothetical protein